MRLRTLSLATLACLGLLGADGCPPQTIQETKLLASDGAEGDRFGSAVAVSGDVAVVGAYDDDDNGTNSGSAYVYRFDGTSWIEEAKLLASDGAADESLGAAVSVSGDVAVVGAYKGDDNGTKSGSAYVFGFDGTNWIEEAKLLASDGTEWDRFGGAVSVSSDVVVVGAYRGEDHGRWSGSAYVYRFDGTSWVEEAKLLASDGADKDYFGYAVSVSGDMVAVGTALDDDNGADSGSAYVYHFDGTSWVEEAKLLPSDGAAEDYFGSAVSIANDVVVVGAARATNLFLLPRGGDDDNGENSGSAYVYRFDGTSWIEEAKLLASDGAEKDYFGTAVSVSGDMVVVGTVLDDDNASNSGSAYVFSNLGITPACSDGIDNDSDGLADLDDPGCAVPLDTSEHSGLFQCDDGIDNDGDGDIDYPDDAACASPTGNFEIPRECDDGIDNDGDGDIDYPDDAGCASPTGDLEDPECDDGIDNDGDGRTDYPADTDCCGPSDDRERSERVGCYDGAWGGAWCGLGWELGPVLAGLMLLPGRRWRRRRI